MTKDNINQYSHLLEALYRGETIQVSQILAKDGGLVEWNDCDEPLFDLPPERYRVKSAPALKPWESDKIPVGALIRDADTNFGGVRPCSVILCARGAWIHFMDPETGKLQEYTASQRV
jgi:hypothetical protein